MAANRSKSRSKGAAASQSPAGGKSRRKPTGQSSTSKGAGKSTKSAKSSSAKKSKQTTTKASSTAKSKSTPRRSAATKAKSPRGRSTTKPSRKGSASKTKTSQRRSSAKFRSKKSFVDPHYEREAKQYDRPIPSREAILQILTQRETPSSLEQIADDLGLDDSTDQESLQKRLWAMTRDGQIIGNRRGSFGLISKMDLIRGRVIGHKEGFGFIAPDDGTERLHLSERQMRQVLHGDRVVARKVGVDRRGRREAAVVEVLERAVEKVVGRFIKENGYAFVIPDNQRINQDIQIHAGNYGGAKNGQIVMAEIISQPTFRTSPIGKISEVLGNHMAPGMEIDVAIRANDIPHEWPKDVLKETKKFASTVSADQCVERLDLRELPLVTIDGFDARDFDDAVYCEPKRSGWRLIVAIADVAHYVKPGSALDQEAYRRGNSVYFPENVIPMLPEVLSNGLCSINAEVDRLCLACEIVINSKGVIKKYKFHNAVMHSHARLTYTEVADMLVENKASVCKKYQHVFPHLQALHQLFKVLHKRRETRGAIDFEMTETKIVFGADRKIEKIIPQQRNEAHRIIEECMLCANVCAAEFLQKHKLPGLFRNHPPPEADRLEDLRDFLSELGLHLRGGVKPKSKDYAQLLETINERADFNLIQTVLLRSLSQAIYHPNNEGHFGLAYDAYCHYTSPIRRYPDLLTHRAIKHILAGHKAKTFHFDKQRALELGEHCSTTERRADDATRDAIDWLKCEYMLDKVGSEFDGIITSVKGFGLFIILKDIYVEGLLHITSLPNEYYRFDAVSHTLTGEQSGQAYRMGDTVHVRVARVDLEQREIDFDLVEQAQGARGERRTRGRGGQNKVKRGSSRSGGQNKSTRNNPKKTSRGKKRR